MILYDVSSCRLHIEHLVSLANFLVGKLKLFGSSRAVTFGDEASKLFLLKQVGKLVTLLSMVKTFANTRSSMLVTTLCLSQLFSHRCLLPLMVLCDVFLISKVEIPFNVFNFRLKFAIFFVYISDELGTFGNGGGLLFISLLKARLFS